MSATAVWRRLRKPFKHLRRWHVALILLVAALVGWALLVAALHRSLGPLFTSG